MRLLWLSPPLPSVVYEYVVVASIAVALVDHGVGHLLNQFFIDSVLEEVPCHPAHLGLGKGGEGLQQGYCTQNEEVRGFVFIVVWVGGGCRAIVLMCRRASAARG